MKKTGFIAGCFDIIHPGYIKLFKEAKTKCDYLFVGLHEDPSIERSNKMKPILSIQERKEILDSIKFIDEILIYKTEKELVQLIRLISPDIRFLGDDYVNKSFTGEELVKEIYYINRDHKWSSTKFKEEIYKNYLCFDLKKGV